MDVTIIIPSTCERSRARTLQRAAESLVSQRGVVPKILIVANGSRIDPQVVQDACALSCVVVEQQTEGSLPNAMRYGVSRVQTAYFGFLDDDDEYLQHALALRVATLEANPEVDVVVTNGYECDNGADQLRVRLPERAASDPLRALVVENWLASCGGLFRTDRVSTEYFDGITRYYEWTLLAYRLASTRRIAFVDIPTFRVHNSPNSLSKSRAFREAEFTVLEQIMSMALPSDVKRALRAKVGRAHHGLASLCLSEGRRDLAIRHHLRSLISPSGLRYLNYSRKFLPFWPNRRFRER